MKDRQVIITFTLPQSMLQAVEEKIEGDSTEEKLVKAIERGYEIATKLNLQKRKTPT